jgi:hypothetical protein
MFRHSGDPLGGGQGLSRIRGGLQRSRLLQLGTYSNIAAPAPPPARRGAMRGNLRRNLLLGLAAAAVAAGLIIALTSGARHHAAKTSARGSSPGDVQLAADYLGISRSQLRRRLRAGGSIAELAESTKGKSVEGLIADLLAHRRTALAKSRRTPAEVDQALARARAQIITETHRVRGQTSGQTRTAAAYLGVSETALRARLRSGESLAQVAGAEGRSRSGLIDALVAVKAKRLQTALAEHVISAKAEQAALHLLRPRVSQTVDRHISTGNR